MMLWSFSQVRPTVLRLGMRQVATRCNRVAKRMHLLRSNVTIVWPEIANAGPTMLGYVALRCCYRLAGA